MVKTRVPRVKLLFYDVDGATFIGLAYRQYTQSPDVECSFVGHLIFIARIHRYSYLIYDTQTGRPPGPVDQSMDNSSTELHFSARVGVSYTGSAQLQHPKYFGQLTNRNVQ